MNEPPDLGATARHLAGDAFFRSSALTAYQDRHRLDAAALAAQLGCPVAVLTSLRLCRRPGAAEPERTAEEDIEDFRRRFGVNAEALRRVLTVRP
jgi:hypothetical protein